MNAPELELWIPIEDGKAVRVRLVTVEEAMPSPGEVETLREPTMGELRTVSRDLLTATATLIKPF